MLRDKNIFIQSALQHVSDHGTDHWYFKQFAFWRTRLPITWINCNNPIRIPNSFSRFAVIAAPLTQCSLFLRITLFRLRKRGLRAVYTLSVITGSIVSWRRLVSRKASNSMCNHVTYLLAIILASVPLNVFCENFGTQNVVLDLFISHNEWAGV